MTPIGSRAVDGSRGIAGWVVVVVISVVVGGRVTVVEVDDSWTAVVAVVDAGAVVVAFDASLRVHAAASNSSTQVMIRFIDGDRSWPFLSPTCTRPETKESMAQGIAINFTVCRDALRVYQQWVTAGIAPTLNPLPTPASPREPSYSDWERSYADLVARAESGEVEKLHAWLTGDGSCGQWIPAIPGQADGPTIADVVGGTPGSRQGLLVFTP